MPAVSHQISTDTLIAADPLPTDTISKPSELTRAEAAWRALWHDKVAMLTYKAALALTYQPQRSDRQGDAMPAVIQRVMGLGLFILCGSAVLFFPTIHVLDAMPSAVRITIETIVLLIALAEGLTAIILLSKHSQERQERIRSAMPKSSPDNLHNIVF